MHRSSQRARKSISSLGLRCSNSAARPAATAAPLNRLASAFADHPRVSHIKIADASGRRLGRSYQVKLWPTLVFLNEGREIARLVRPRDESAIRQNLELIDGAK